MEPTNLSTKSVGAPASSDYKSDTVSHLTKKGIWEVKDLETSQLYKDQKLVVQVTAAKMLDQTSKFKSQMTLSDGVSSMQAILTEAIFNKLTQIPKLHDVIRINKFKVLELKGQKLMVLVDPIQILLENQTKVFGNPTGYKKILDNQANFELDKEVMIPCSQASVKEPSNVRKEVEIKPKEVPAPVKAQFVPEPKKIELTNKIKDDDSNNYMPIKALNTFTRDWVIKARVSQKTPMRQTQKGGQLLKLELVDQLGTQIEATFFNDSAKQYNDLISENGVYLFSNGSVKLANKRFTTVKNDFCLIFNVSSSIQKVEDDSKIAKQAFDFTRIGDIEDQVQLKSVDVLGIVTYCSETEQIKLKDGTFKSKKTVVVADQSMCSISMTLWGDEACQKFSFSYGQLVAVKGARVSEYQGKSLNADGKNQQIFTDVDHQDASKLKQQFDQHSKEDIEGMKCLTQRMNRDFGNREGGANQENKPSNLNLIKEITDSINQENDVDKAHFYFLNGYVQRVRNDDKLFYPACPNDSCRRKVCEDAGGYRCENCAKTYDSYNPTYMIQAKISDFSESIFVNFSRDQGTTLMGKTAKEFEAFRQQNDEQTVSDYFDQLTFKQLNVMVRGKFEYYQNEPKMKFFAVKTYPRNVMNENKALLERLEVYSQMECAQ